MHARTGARIIHGMRRTPSSAEAIKLRPGIARAAKRTAAATGRSVSDLANQGLQQLLQKRELALKLAKARRNGKVRDYEDVVADLRRDGHL